MANILRKHYKEICRILHASPTTLASFTIALYTKSIINLDTKSEVLRTKGLEGADALLSHVMLKLQSNPRRFEIVLEMVKDEDALSDVGKEMESLFYSSGESPIITTNRRIPVVEDPPTDAVHFAKHLKSMYDELIDIIHDSVKGIEVSKLRVRLNVFFMSDECDGQYSDNNALLCKLDLCKTTEEILLCLLRANFIGYLNYKLLEVFAKVSSDKQALMSIKDYQKEYLKLFRCNFPSLIKVFSNPRLMAIPPVSLPEFTVRLGKADGQSDLYTFKEFFEKRFSWAEHLLILEIIENCILIKYGVLPFFVSAIARDLSDPTIVEELKEASITIELSPQLKDMARYEQAVPPFLQDITSSDVTMFLKSYDLAITEKQKSKLWEMAAVNNTHTNEDKSHHSTYSSPESNQALIEFKLQDLSMEKVIDEHVVDYGFHEIIREEFKVEQSEDDIEKQKSQLQTVTTSEDKSEIDTVISEDYSFSTEILELIKDKLELPIDKSESVADKISVYEEALKQLLEEREGTEVIKEMNKKMMIELDELKQMLKAEKSQIIEKGESNESLDQLNSNERSMMDPLIENTPRPTTQSSPTLESLCKELEDLVEWGRLAQCIPYIPIQTIKSQGAGSSLYGNKLLFYDHWLSSYPNLSWSNVIDVLINAQEYKLAIKLEGHFPYQDSERYVRPLTVHTLSLLLCDLVDWEGFATNLPQITPVDVQLVKYSTSIRACDSKLALFERWLKVTPDGSWDDVINALHRAGEHKLAWHVMKMQNFHPLFLHHLLKTLTNWEKLGLNLYGITSADIQHIKSQYNDLPSSKFALYHKWILKYPDASWEGVVNALGRAGEHKLAHYVHTKWLSY